MMDMRVMVVMNLDYEKFHLLILFAHCENICKRRILLHFFAVSETIAMCLITKKKKF